MQIPKKRDVCGLKGKKKYFFITPAEGKIAIVKYYAIYIYGQINS